MAEGRFREDLYYRLNVLNLTLPPLRDRVEDIEPLAYAYFDKFTRDKNSKAQGFSRQALQVMKQYAWPGNVRELVNRIRRATVMCERRLITPVELGLDQYWENSQCTLKEAREIADRRVIDASLRQAGNNVSVAARSLGISRLTLYRLMEKYGLRTSATFKQ